MSKTREVQNTPCCRIIGLLTLLAVVGGLICSATAVAQDTFTPVYHPTLEVAKTATPIDIDGRLDDAGWQVAGRASNFAEHTPGDQTQPPVETVALMTYDDDKLYVAFICYDDPSLIRASLCERDHGLGTDDNVALLLDTYGDAAWAYEIFVNAYGVQGDALFSSNGGEDEKYDLIWESAGQITDSGYQVEIAIPFSSMRFPNREEQVWKVDFWRNHPRASRAQYSWAAYDRDEQCWPCQWGTVTGVRNVKSGKGIEILPSIVGYQSGALTDGEDPDSPFDNDDIDGKISLGAKYSISSDITVEATYNPDFSQVESDDAQIDVNTTFALWYSERRPFVQEGSDLFETHFNAVYTRSINDPLFAAKFTGRKSRTSFAYLVARDEHSPITLPFEERSRFIQAGKSTSNILRVRQSFGEDSRVGIIMTDRRLDDGGSGSLLGADGTIRLSTSNSIEWQFNGTYTEEPDDPALSRGLNDTDFERGAHTAGFDGETFWGYGVYGGLKHESRRWDIELDYLGRSPTFRVDNGYEPQNDWQMAELDVGHIFYPDSRLFEYINPYGNIGRVWNYDGVQKDEWVIVNLSTQLKIAQTNLHAQYLRSNELFREIQFDDIWGAHFCASGTVSEFLRGGFGINYGHRVARDDLVMGMQTSGSAWFELKPTDRILIQPEFEYIKSDHIDTGEELFAGYTARTRIGYQLIRELSLRLVVQYDDFDGTWEVDPLLTYRLNPFSIFYIGSTYDYYDIADNDPTDHDNGRRRLASRQFFMKLQYLFQI